LPPEAVNTSPHFHKVALLNSTKNEIREEKKGKQLVIANQNNLTACGCDVQGRS